MLDCAAGHGPVRQGMIQAERNGQRIRKGKDGLEFVLVPAQDSGTDWDIGVTQTDIANLIRSKGSIYSAAKVPVDKAGMQVEDIDKIYIGGGFGNYLDIEKAVTIGLLPDLPPSRYEFIENGSLAGARMALLSADVMRKTEEIAERMTNIELCTEHAYMREYVNSLCLPHTDTDLFPTVKRKMGA